jgi:hypothetical protein
MGDVARELPENDARAALVLMEEALAVLDRLNTEVEVAAHLDLAICRLREALQSATGGVQFKTAGRQHSPDTSP